MPQGHKSGRPHNGCEGMRRTVETWLSVWTLAMTVTFLVARTKYEAKVT